MHGLGERAEETPAHPEISMLSFDRTWKPAVEPLHRLWETKDSAQYKMTPYLGFDMTREQLDAMYDELHPLDLVSPVGGVGPGYFFAVEMHKLTGAPIGLVPCALGGSSLDMWGKDFGDRNGEAFSDILYGDMIDRIRLAEGNLKGVLWYQGESDAQAGLVETYVERFQKFVGDLRTDLGRPDLPFITVQLATTTDHEWAGVEPWMHMRENQRRATELIPGVKMVAAADLPRVDGIHLSYAAHQKLGVRLARAASGQFSVPALGGLESLDSGKAIGVQFSDVNGKLHANSDIDRCFKVSGAEITSVEIEPPDTVVLELSDRAGPGMEVWHGYGFEPEVGLIDEAEFLMPLFWESLQR